MSRDNIRRYVKGTDDMGRGEINIWCNNKSNKEKTALCGIDDNDNEEHILFYRKNIDNFIETLKELKEELEE